MVPVSRAAHLAIMIIGIGHDRASNTETRVTPLGKVAGARPVCCLPENMAADTEFSSISNAPFYLLIHRVLSVGSLQRNVEILLDMIIAVVYANSCFDFLRFLLGDCGDRGDSFIGD